MCIKLFPTSTYFPNKIKKKIEKMCIGKRKTEQKCEMKKKKRKNKIATRIKTSLYIHPCLVVLLFWHPLAIHNMDDYVTITEHQYHGEPARVSHLDALVAGFKAHGWPSQAWQKLSLGFLAFLPFLVLHIGFFLILVNINFECGIRKRISLLRFCS